MTAFTHHVRSLSFVALVALMSACADDTIIGPGLPATVAIVQGDDQHAAPSANVPLPLVLEVLDDAGKPVRGTDVTLSVTTGQVSPSVVTTGANGRVSIRGWTLGPEVGEQVLSATIDGAGSTSARAVAIRSASGVRVQIVDPEPASVVDDELDVRVRVTSTFSVSSVTASVGTTSVSLTYDSEDGDYLGTLSLAGMSRDALTLVATAVDANGATSDTALKVIHDRAPALVVTSPLGSSVAMPTVQLAVACEDDDPAGCDLTVTHDGALITQGTNAIEGTFALAGSGSTWLRFTARDSRGQERSTLRRIFVEPPALLEEVAAAPGVVLDYAAGRLLYIDSTAASPIAVARAIGGADAPVSMADGFTVESGVVLPDGALVLAWSSVGGHSWYRLDGGSVSVEAADGSPALRRTDDWVAYGSSPLLRRAAASGDEITVAPNSPSFDIGANGTVFYLSSGDLFEFDGVAATPVATSEASVIRAPRTDGEQVVYQRELGCCATSSASIVLHDGDEEIELAPARTGRMQPGADYAINGGWVAFTRKDAMDRLQVWTRSPTGTTEQVSFLGSDVAIDALGPDGTVVFSGGLQRFRARAGSPVDQVMSANGVATWEGDRFVVWLGRMVYAIR